MINRILIVGTGSAGSRHLYLAKNLFPEAEIKVLKLNKSEGDLETTGKTLRTLDDALKFKPQIAIIANPSTFHVDVAMSLASIGSHLLIEKPISNSIDKVLELIALCREKNLVLMTGYNLRFLPSLISFKRFLDESYAGEIFSVRTDVGQYLPNWRPSRNYQDSVSANKSLGGGVILELSHEIDYLRWIFGEVEWVSGILTKQSNLEIDVEDTAHITLGMFAHETRKQLIISANLDFVRHDSTRMCIAICENGSLRWDGIVGEVAFMKPDSHTWEVIFSETVTSDYTYRKEWENFVKCIIQNETPVVTGLDGLKTVEIVEAIRESSKLGNRVFVTHSTMDSDKQL